MVNNDQQKKESETMSEKKIGEDMGKTLVAAGKKAEQIKAARRERVVKGSHLLNTLQERAAAAGLKIEEKSGFLKITLEGNKGRAIYVAKKGGRCDFSGFTVDAPAVTQITEEDARQKHLGKVRGQLDFTQVDDVVLAAYGQALKVLATPEVKETKAVTPKVTKAPKTTTTVTTAQQ
jgi:hypothetical protein